MITMGSVTKTLSYLDVLRGIFITLDFIGC